MKRYGYLALMLLCVWVFASCGKDDETLVVDEVWKARNEEAFLAQTLAPDFSKLNSQSNAGFILYKVVKTGESKEQIYYTSKVKLYYKGTLIDGTVFDDKSFENSSGATFNVGEVVDGFSTALQNMHPGDRWTVWIPQQMGYGIAGSSGGSVTIMPYSTLIFDIEVIEVVKQ